MIAQGEFRKVLTADTQERVEILRKVFGTEIYDEAKKELKIKENKAREDYKKIYSLIENKLMRNSSEKPKKTRFRNCR